MKKGDWIQTHTGIRFYPLDPQPEDICLEDIAHALSNTCRYNGHSKSFYSVAEHSVEMSYFNNLYQNMATPQWLLMHDAAEAYLSDVPRPIKPMLPEFKKIEDNILRVIAERFRLGIPNCPAIHFADNVMLATEKRDVIAVDICWDVILPDPLGFNLSLLTPGQAELSFCLRAKELGLV